MIRHFTFHLLLTLTCSFIVSCATVEEKTSPEELAAQEEKAIPEEKATVEEITSKSVDWVDEQQKRQQIKIWEIRGRLGIQTENTGGGLDIIWKQSDEEYSIRLIAPLATGNYLILGNDDFAEVRYPDGQKAIIHNVDDVFSVTLEIDLPVTAIKDWIRGLPAKTLSVDSIRRNEQGMINKLKQSGWNVEMTDYSGNKIFLPHAIYLTRDDDPELDIRLVIRQWLVDNE